MASKYCNKIKIAAWNSQSIYNKIGEVEDFTQKHNIDILMLNETWLKNNKKIYIKGFKCIRKDRKNENGGGVAILIKNSYRFNVETLNTITSIEHLTISIKNTNNEEIYLTSLYNRPQNKLNIFELEEICKQKNKIIIAGDFNAHNTLWNCIKTNTNGEILEDICIKKNWAINFPDTPTHFSGTSQPSTIDLAITKGIQITKPISLPEMSSNHNPITFEILLHEPLYKSKYIYDYPNADWKKFRSELNQQTQLPPDVSNKTSIENAISNITYIINQCMKNCIPCKKEAHLQEIPDNIRQLIRNRNNIRRKWQRSRDQHLKRMLNSLNILIKTEIDNHKNEIIKKKIKGLSNRDNSLWKKLRQIKQKNSQVSELKINNKLITRDEEKANIIAARFEEVHRQTENLSNKRTEKIVNETLQNFERQQQPTLEEHMLIKPAEIRKIIQKLKNLKAPGEDGIQNIILKNLPRKVLVYLTYVYNGCIKARYFPTCWKTAIVLAFPKHGKDPTQPENYRPISLLNTMSKVLEKIILNKIKMEINPEHLTQNEQFGFKDEHSTEQQLVRITEKIATAFNKRKSVGMVLLDIQKAFDCVWHKGLLYKLIMLQTPDYITAILKSYLENRKFKVKLNDEYSELKTCSAGVPQGSLLGPILFNIYVRDLPQTKNTDLALFADDTAICATSTLPEAIVRKLQTAINQLKKYYNKWKIKINSEKCEAILFTQRKRKPKKYVQYNKTKIPWKQDVKYLGIILDNKLTWKEHINKNVKNAKIGMAKLMTLIHPESTLQQEYKLLLYNQVIRPALTYGSTVWGNAAQTHIKKLQIIQNKFLRLILLKRRRTKITELHEYIKQPTIQEFIKKKAMQFYQKTRFHSNHLIQNLGQYDITRLPRRHLKKLPHSILD